MTHLVEQKRTLKTEILREMKTQYQLSRPPRQYWLFTETVRKLTGELTIKRLEAWLGNLKEQQG